MREQEAQELLELLKLRTFSYDTLTALFNRCRQILTGQGFGLPPEEVIALFAVARRSFDAAGSIEEIHGDTTKHLEIEAAIKLPLLAVLESLASRKVDAQAVKQLIVARIQMEPGLTPH